MKRTLLALTMVTIANTGQAHDQANCQSIDELLARLACYDESHGGANLTGSALKRSNTPTSVAATTSKAESSSSVARQPRGLFSNDRGESFEAVLTEISKHPKRMTRLYLSNDQVWGLVKERLLSASVGDSVAVKPGTMGGYRMSINNSSWFRVKRLN